MIHVFSAVTGEPVADLNAEDFEGKSDVVLKNFLSKQSGFSRFQQRLLSEDVEITGDNLTFPQNLQLVFLEHLPADAEQDERLALACSDNNADEVEKILSQPRDPDTKRPDGRTPLHFAAEKGSLECASLLLEAGADKEVKAKGKTPLHLAALNGHVELLRFLIESGAEKDACAGNGATCLHLAAHKGRTAAVRALLEFRAAINEVTTDGRTALHFAAEFGRLEVARLLLQAGAEKEQPTTDEHCLTPLHWAAYSGHLELVRLLLENGCDKQKTTKPFDETPSQLALSVGHAEVACLLDEWK
eukprot:Skav200149  [mRNA]  locus=scaffold2013:334194:335099:- [translate_table: standard]